MTRSARRPAGSASASASRSSPIPVGSSAPTARAARSAERSSWRGSKRTAGVRPSRRRRSSQTDGAEVAFDATTGPRRRSRRDFVALGVASQPADVSRQSARAEPYENVASSQAKSSIRVSRGQPSANPIVGSLDHWLCRLVLLVSSCRIPAAWPAQDHPPRPVGGPAFSERRLVCPQSSWWTMMTTSAS